MVPLLWLAIAGLLEVGGDALMRWGLRGGGKAAGIALGAAVLGVYGVSVNLPSWDFGRLLGVYIAVFFVISQLVAALAFREPVRAPHILGGLLIVAGGLVIALWKPA